MIASKKLIFFLWNRGSQHIHVPQVRVRAQKPCYLWAIRGWLGECSKMVEAATGHLLPRNPHTLDGSGQPHFQATGFIRSSHCAANIHKDQTWKTSPRTTCKPRITLLSLWFGLSSRHSRAWLLASPWSSIVSSLLFNTFKNFIRQVSFSRFLLFIYF